MPRTALLGLWLVVAALSFLATWTTLGRGGDPQHTEAARIGVAAPAPGETYMALDCKSSTAAVDAGPCSKAGLGGPFNFTVDLHLHTGTHPSDFYQAKILFDNTVIDFDPCTTASLADLGIAGGGMFMSPKCADSGATGAVLFSFNQDIGVGDITVNGAVTRLTFKCIGDGTSALTLTAVGGAVLPVFSSKLGIDAPTGVAPPVLDLFNTSISCVTLEPTADDDGDGCANVEELGPNKTLGGQRDPLNPYDFYDLTGLSGVLGAKDKGVSGFDSSLLASYGGTAHNGPPNGLGKSYDADTNSNTIADGLEMDFAGLAGPATGPDGGISGFDASYLSSQGGDSCVAPP